MNRFIISFMLLCLCAVVTVTHAAYGPEIVDYQDQLNSQAIWYSACKDRTTGWAIQPGRTLGANCAATGWFVDDLFGNIAKGGWTYLRIITNPSFVDDADQAYAAGYLEGYLANQRIFSHTSNSMQDLFGTLNIDISLPPTHPSNNIYISQPTIDFVNKQFQFNMLQVKKNRDDPFWVQTGLLYQQLQGIFDGYNTFSRNGKYVAWEWLLYLQLSGDIPDIIAAVSPSDSAELLRRKFPTKINPFRMATSSHCSSIVRWLPDKSDLYHAHTTWSTYAYLTRTWKLYEFHFSNTPGVTIQFASYPAVLNSLDDFYQIAETGLSVTETTMNVINQTIYQYVVPSTVASWARSMIANRLAADAQDWTRHFARYNSGTYNNQWMIVNHNLFTPGANTLPDNLFWVICVAPGLTKSIDATDWLRQKSYWASYNIPHMPELWTWLGYQMYNSTVEGGGPFLWDFNLSFRALAFDALTPNATTLNGLQKLMLHNKWQTDSFSANCSGLAIAARNDLETPACPAAWGPPFNNADGGYDSKITRSTWFKDGSLMASCTNGPTHDDQPPFQFSTAVLSQPIAHLGLPDKWEYPFVRFWRPKN